MNATNKKVLSAVIGALIAGATTTAVANENKGPTFYGNFNVSVDVVDGEGAKTAGPTFSENSDHVKVSSHNSRFGFTQEIGLDHGLTALLKAEVKANIDQGANTTPFERREMYAGIKGNFGQIVAGRINRPLRTVEGRIDQFNHLYGDINTVLGGETFTDNTVQYTTPKLGNFLIKAAYVAAEKETQTSTNHLKDGVSASVTYDNGALYAAFGYEYSVVNVGADNIDVAGSAINVDRARLGLQYNFGSATLGALVQHQVNHDDSDKEDFAYVVNGSYTIQKTKLKAQYGSVEAEQSKNSRDFIAVGADYSLGKGSYVYLTYTQIHKDLKTRIGTVPTTGPDLNAVGKYTDKIFQIGFNQAF